MQKLSLLNKTFWAMSVMCLGAALVGAPFLLFEQFSVPSTFSFLNDNPEVSVANSEVVVMTSNAQDQAITISPEVRVANVALMSKDLSGTEVYETRTLAAESFEIPKSGIAVVADLGEMMLRVYENNQVVEEFPIMSKGKPGSLWETPTGSYKIKTKEEKHYSTIGDVWMPSSMQFFGNFFIHGWPYYPDGRPVPEGYSGGCIRLSNEHAKKLFDRVKVGVKIFVTNSTHPNSLIADRGTETMAYMGRDKFVPPPNISAKSAIVADLSNGFVFFEKNPNEVRPIASISKLMTALVSLEAVNQFRNVTITDNDINIEGSAGGLYEGQKMTVQDLLYPLLLSSSNDAAYAIARVIGERTFVGLMNEKASSLGLTDTAFVEPSGLDDDNRSTSVDLFRFTQYLWFNKKSLLDMTNQRSHKVWRNIHPFVSLNTFQGGKTGFIPEAKKTVVSVFTVPFGEFEERPVAIVALGSDNIRIDTERLRVWAKNNFYYGFKQASSDAVVRYTTLPANGNGKSFSLLFAGDVMMNRGVEDTIQKQASGNWEFPFDQIRGELSDADITFGNLEGPVSDKGTDRHNLYSFRMNPGVIPALKNVGFDVVSLANNHIGDWGREAFEDTMRRLRREGVQYVGAGWNKQEALTPTIFETKGKRVGYLAFTDVGPNELRAGEALSGIAIADFETVENAVRQSKGLVDILVVSFHYGDEYQSKPNARQQKLARLAVDAGARVVVGHHPHVVQRIEEYNGGVIAYSLGNFIFDQNFSEETMTGLLVKVEFEGDNISAVVPTPVIMNEFYQPRIE